MGKRRKRTSLEYLLLYSLIQSRIWKWLKCGNSMQQKWHIKWKTHPFSYRCTSDMSLLICRYCAHFKDNASRPLRMLNVLYSRCELIYIRTIIISCCYKMDSAEWACKLEKKKHLMSFQALDARKKIRSQMEKHCP